MDEPSDDLHRFLRPVTPSRRATLYELTILTQGIGKVLAAYRKRLEEDGVPEGEAYALTQRLEERLLGPLFDDAKAPPRLPRIDCIGCGRDDRVVDVSGEDGTAYLCLYTDCGHHWMERSGAGPEPRDP